MTTITRFNLTTGEVSEVDTENDPLNPKPAPSTNTDYDDLVERLRATALHPIENNIAYIQTAVALMREAAAAIIALQGERDGLEREVETFWRPEFKASMKRAEAAAAIIALRGERDRLRAEYERAILQQLELRKAAEAKLGDLLAIIHRDGGHYQETHGTEKAVNDAHLIWADLMSKAEEAEAEVARLRARVEALGKEIAETRKHKNYVEALEDRLHWVLYSGPLNLSENRMRWLHEPFGDDLSKLPPPVAGRSAPRCAECHGSGQISRSAEAEVARLKAELAKAHQVIEPFAKLAGYYKFDAADDHVADVVVPQVGDLRRARSFRDGQKTGEKG